MTFRPFRLSESKHTLNNISYNNSISAQKHTGKIPAPKVHRLPDSSLT